MRKTCENCLWRDQCPESGVRCEFYDPVDGAENIALREYKKSLYERSRDYLELLEEQWNSEN